MTDHHPNKRRQFLSYAAALPLALYLPVSDAASKQLAGKIHELTGTVYINKQLANVTSVVRSGDRVNVAHDGNLIFSMADDTYMLQGGSSLELMSRDGNVITGLRLLTGGLLSVFGARQNTAKIYTRTATIGIRGTGVYLNSQPEKLYFCTCYGNTDLDLGHNHVEHIHSTHHNAFDVTGNTANTMKMLATQVIDHTDDDLRLLEHYSGRKPPFDV